MDFEKFAGWIRGRLLDFFPEWLDSIPDSWPDWLLYLVAPVVIVLLMGLILNAIFDLIRKARRGFQDAGKIAKRSSIEDPNPATEEGQAGIQVELENARAESAEMRAMIEKILATVSPSDVRAPLDLETQAAKKSAVVNLITDSAPDARKAAEDLALGDARSGFDTMEAEARAAEAEAAEKWRRLGALATGVDTRRARVAYEEAFRLQPEDFWTCIALARLRRQSGDLRASEEVAVASGKIAGSDREKIIANTEIGDVLVQAGDLASARARFEQGLEVREQLARQNPGSAEAQRDLSVSLERVGDVDEAAGNIALAIEASEKSLPIAQSLADQFKNFPQFQSDISITKNRIRQLKDQLMKRQS